MPAHGDVCSRGLLPALIALSLAAPSGAVERRTPTPSGVRVTKPRGALLSSGSQRQLLSRLASGEELPAWLARLARDGAVIPEDAPRRDAWAAPGGGEPPGEALSGPVEGPRSIRSSPPGTLVIPANIPVSNPGGDPSGIGQAEESIAMLGNYGLCAWNDGLGFTNGSHRQGVAFTADRGASWADLGAPPAPVGATWTSDPVVTVNEKTGEFWYCGLLNPNGSTNGIAVVRGTPVGMSLTWDTPVIVESVSNSAAFLDKQWLAADSVSGNLYLSFTRFFPGGDQVEARRSTDGGATWTQSPIKLNTNSSDGFVQGSRVAVGPAGEVYAIWFHQGAVDQDTFYVKKSTNQGLSFGSQRAAMGGYLSWGNGAPGFNRPRGITFPSIAVDRSQGARRGRAYVAWNEAYNFYDDALGTLGRNPEVENNNFFNRANAITVGQRLNGLMASNLPADHDVYSFAGTQGDNVIFFMDSLSNTVTYLMRVYCGTDTTQELALGGSNVNPGRIGLIVFTLPATGTFFLRVTALGGAPGGYTIGTGSSPPGPERGRDRRDVFVNYSDDGIAWSTPVRVNDDSPYYDNWLPEVAVSAEGFPYVMWYDFRDAAPCGGASHIYLSRSSDGGATWATDLRVTSVQTAWSATSSNIAPNQGDYQGMAADGLHVYPCWADGRLGDPDIYMSDWDLTFKCLPPGDVVWVEGTVNDITYTVTNNAAFAQNYDYRLTSTRAWPGFPITGQITVPAQTTSNLVIGVPVPASEPAGLNLLVLRVWLAANPAVRDSCDHNIHDAGTPALGALVSATAGNGRAHITWWLSVRDEARVYRATAGDPWQLLATRMPDGSGRVEFEDAAVEPGRRYGYRLGIPFGEREAMLGEVWLDIPRTAAVALRGARPNPSGGDAAVSFSLESGAPATLELLDLSGRRVWSREVGSLGPGLHVVPLGARAAALPAGIYVIRVAQGGRGASGRLVILR